MIDDARYELVDAGILPAASLDMHGRCCGRKPITYRRVGGPHHFCDRCNRAFALDTGVQISNWAWKQVDGGFQSTKKRKVAT